MNDVVLVMFIFSDTFNVDIHLHDGIKVSTFVSIIIIRATNEPQMLTHKVVVTKRQHSDEQYFRFSVLSFKKFHLIQMPKINDIK